jgi:hypothetical protein
MRNTYHLRRRNVADLKEAVKLRAAMREKKKDRIRTADRFLRFCRLNYMEPFAVGTCTAFLATVRVQLSAASAAKAAFQLRVIRKEMKADPIASEINGAARIYTEEHARKTVVHSPDVRSRADAIKCLREILCPHTRCISAFVRLT